MGRVRYIGEHPTDKEIEHSKPSDWNKKYSAARDGERTWLIEGIRRLRSTDDQDSEIFKNSL